MARMPAFDRAISVVLTGARDKVQKQLAGIVHDELARVQRESNPSGYEQFIDGTKDKPIDQIEPFGVAIFHFSYSRELVKFAVDALRAVSPVLSGDYRSAHEIFADGSLVTDLSQIGDARTVVITNTLPYARKIEGGRRFTGWNSGHRSKTTGAHYEPEAMSQRKGSSSQAPDGVYELTAATVNRRFGNIAKTRFAYVGVTGGGISENAKGRGRFPALVIEFGAR